MVKWQPVLLILEDRLECDCGSLAIFIMLDKREDSTLENANYDHKAYCQQCFEKAQEEEKND